MNDKVDMVCKIYPMEADASQFNVRIDKLVKQIENLRLSNEKLAIEITDANASNELFEKYIVEIKKQEVFQADLCAEITIQFNKLVDSVNEVQLQKIELIGFSEKMKIKIQTMEEKCELKKNEMDALQCEIKSIDQELIEINRLFEEKSAPIQSENDNYKNQKMGLARQLSTHQTTIQLRTKEKFEIIGENKAQQEIAVALNDKVKELDDILSKLIEKQKSINVEIDTVRKARETSIVANQQLSDKLKLIDIELNQLKVPKTISKGLGAKDSCTARSVFDNNLDKSDSSGESFVSDFRDVMPQRNIQIKPVLVRAYSISEDGVQEELDDLDILRSNRITVRKPNQLDSSAKTAGRNN